MNTIQSKKLGEKYILLDLLGIGGMAEVYRSKLLGEKGFEKQVVIKKLLPQVAQDWEMVDLFIGEAKLAAMLQHENIASTFDFGEIDGTYFLAMEYLSGVDLHSLITRKKEMGGALELKYVLMIASKICAGMEYAHRLRDFQNKPLNIIHRDLTPHNIFITYDGKVKIFDFGIAKAEILDNKTRAGVVKGKLSYMSPEQIGGDTVDLRSDIFSIGILLYEMLCGKKMYEGDTATLIQKCLTADYEPLRSRIPDLPDTLYTILDKALSKDKDLRYQSCAEMAADIDDFMFSMSLRPDPKILQDYVRSIFASEFRASQNRSIMAMNENVLSTESAGADKTQILHQEDAKKESVETDHTSSQQKTRDLTSRSRDKSPLKDKRVIVAVIAILVAALVVVGGIRYFSNGGSDNSSLSREERALEKAKKKLDKLFTKAEQSFAANRLVEPTGNCALKYYTEILSIEPQNALAKAGINKIADSLATDAMLAYKKNDLEQASRYVELGLEVAPDHSDLLTVKREIANIETANNFANLAETAMKQGRIAEAQGYITAGLAGSPNHEQLLLLHDQNSKKIDTIVNELAEKVRERLEENKLTTPIGDSALTYINEIKKISPESAVAKEGIMAIADRYADMADEAYRLLNIDRAKVYVAKGLELVPDHKRLLAIQLDLTRSKPGILFQSVKKNIGTILNQ